MRRRLGPLTVQQATTQALKAPLPGADMKTAQRDVLGQTLKKRFESHMHRHPTVAWADVHARLNANKLEALQDMEATGGEPDIVGSATADGTYLFCDCTAESPSGRRSLCYDAQALHARKLHKPQNSAIEAAAAMGVTLLTEAQYRALQEVEDFDQKTSSWIWTPASSPPEHFALQKLDEGACRRCNGCAGRIHGIDASFAQCPFREQPNQRSTADVTLQVKQTANRNACAIEQQGAQGNSGIGAQLGRHAHRDVLCPVGE